MDSNIAVALITGGFSSLIGIAALMINSKRLDDIVKRLDNIENRLSNIEGHIVEFASKIARLEVKVGIE